MSCDNVITVQDLETDKKHSTFYREVITGKAGGTGADIDSATNAVTGQTQATLPKVLSNVGFSPAGFDFTTGGTLTERDKAIFYQADGNWYSWGGTLPKVVPPASSPAATGGIADNAWNVSTSAFMYRDWEGFTSELLYQGGVPDNGQPDELGNSKRVDAMRKMFQSIGTVADIAAGKFKVGDNVCVTDRIGAIFDIVEGGFPDGKGVLDAGGGNTAVIRGDGTSVKIAELGYTIGSDASPFISYAAAKGFKNIILPKSDSILMSQIDLINSDWAGVTVKGAGSGLAYTPNTRIKPIGTQDCLFASLDGVSGADSITFDNVMLDGDLKCGYGVRQLAGAGWNYTNLQIKNFLQWGLYSEQGLNMYNRIYGSGGSSLGVIAAYSDSVLNVVECTGGADPIRIMAGGCRLDNILANSGTESCITLEPLDDSTNHINTALSNIYIGEVNNPLPRPHLRIIGNSTRRVTDVQIVNMHTVSASTSGVKHNRHISIVKADRVLINGWAALGIGAFETANLYDDGGLDATDSTGIDINSATIHNLSKNPIVATNSEIRVGSGVTISDWSGAFDLNPAKPAILSDDLSRVKIDSGSEFLNNRVNATRIGASNSGSLWNIGSIRSALAGSIPDSLFSFISNHAGYVLSESKLDYKFKGETTYSGQVNTPNGGGAVNLMSLPSFPENRNYRVTVQQVGTGANATSGMAFTFNNTIGAATTCNTNTIAALQNTITASAGNLVFTAGTGYGLTTWSYNITRMA